MKKIKRPMFFGKKGLWGEHGYIRISFWKYLQIRREHVTKIKWFECWEKQK